MQEPPAKLPAEAPPWTFRRRPSALAIHARALRPRPGLRRGGGFPALDLRWPDHRIEPAHRAAFRRLTGLVSDEPAAVLYPHALAFPLLMALLTHPDFPVSLFGALQVRNRMTWHAPLPADAALHLRTRVAEGRIVEKGAEVDLHTTIHTADALLWEDVTTFYYRGSFGTPSASPPGSRPPAVPGGPSESWRAPVSGAWAFARLIGDYNPVHWCAPYARLMRFPRAFLHPHRLLAQCLARVPRPPGEGAERLETWLRGPVFYGAEVHLTAEQGDGGSVFAIRLRGDDRPAVLARRSAGRPAISVP